MAKVMVSPAVYDFTDLRPASRALTIRPRPKSSCASQRSQSRNSSRTESELDISLRSQVSPHGVFVVSPRKREVSVISMSSFGGSQSPDPKLSSIEVESLLRERIRANFAEIKQAFQSLDAEKNLCVTKSEFRRVLDTFCFPLTNEQFEQLLKKIGNKRDGTVGYGDFMDKFHHRGGTPDGLKWLGSLHRYQQSRTPTEQDYEEIEKRLRTKINGQLQSVLKAMRLFDYNRDGHIQRHELRRVLENFCFKLSDVQFNKLWCKYDMVRNGSTLEYMDFLRRLGVDAKRKDKRGAASKIGKAGAAADESQRVKLAAVNIRPSTQASDSSTEPPATLRDLEQKLRRKMVDNFGNISRAFVAFDRRGNGFVTLDELKRVLFHFAFPMSDYLFEQLMDRCGIRANHKIAYEQFLDKFQEPRAAGNGQTIPIRPNHRVNPIREAEDLSSTEDIWKQLRTKVQDSFTTVKQAFLVFDDNKDGRVTKRDFRRVLESFCFRMSEPQFQELMARIDPHNKGYISYLEFLDRFEARETKDAHPWLNGDSTVKSISPPAVVAWSTVEDILRSKITENWKSIASAYMKVDDNRDGSVSGDELRRLLEKYCLPLSDDHFDMLWSRCDTNADETIDFEEFLNKLGVDIVSGDFEGTSTRIHDESEARANFMREDQTVRQELAEERAFGLIGQMNADEVMKILKDHVAQRSSNFRKTFVRFDSDGDGKISRKEFRLALESLGLYMADEQFRLLSARLGFHKGKLAYIDFLDHFQDRRTFGVGERVTEYHGKRHNQPVPLDDAMDAFEVEMKLRNKLRESFKDLREAFHKIDFDRNGVVTRAEFRRILDSLMFFLTDEEFDKLMTRLGVKRGGRLNYIDFLKQFEHTEKIEEGHRWLYSNHSFKETRDMAYLSADDADRIIKQKAQQQMDNVAKAFLAFDRDGNGVVTKKEMRKVLYRFQIPMEKEEFNKLWDRYDTDGNGHVDHQEFLAKLGVELAPGDFHGPSTRIAEQSYDVMTKFHQSQKEFHEASTVNQVHTTAFLSALEVEQQLKDKFRDGYESFRKAFEAADSNRDGYVSKLELQKMLFDFHFYLDDVQLGILLDRCGLSGKSRLSYEKFLSAFQDNRQSGYGRVTLDTPLRRPSPVVFESHEDLPPDLAIARLRTTISENYDNVKKAFSAFDREGTGFITKKDLHQIINAFCFWMSPKQFQALLKQVDVIKGGLIAYEDFLHSFQKSDAEASRRWLENLHPSSQGHRRETVKHRRTISDGEVDRKISEVVVARFYSFAKAFTDNDIHHRGRVSRDTLRKILNEHAFRMNDEQFDHVWGKFGSDADRAIDYKEFLKEYSSRPDVRRASSATPTRSRERQSPPETPVLSAVYSPIKRFSRDSISPTMSASDVERKIKDQVCRNWQQLQKSFRNADLSNTGTVNFDQMKEILWKHHIVINPDEFVVLCRKHDTEGKETVVYKDFLRHFVLSMKSRDTVLSRPKLQPTKVSLSPGVKSDQLVDLMATIRSQVRENWKEMRRAFRALDKAANGTCDPVEFRQLLRRFKIDLDEEEFFHLFSFYDKNMIGRISYNDFLRAHLE